MPSCHLELVDDSLGKLVKYVLLDWMDADGNEGGCEVLLVG